VVQKCSLFVNVHTKENVNTGAGGRWSKKSQNQYKKLAPNALRFTYQNLKSCKSHEKNETKNIRPLVFIFLPIDLAFDGFVLFLHGVCKISNFDKKIAMHLAKASCTELTVTFPTPKYSGSKIAHYVPIELI
jgi:hypothetical protein